jgi:hypothetical protein
MWVVELADEFDPEFDALDEEVQDELLAQMNVIRQLGPLAKRPRVDTLKGSKHANMKELRFSAGGGEWRAAFAFDAARKAVVLVAGDKSGAGSEQRFYSALIAIADRRFDAHLARLKSKRRV